MYYLCNPHPHTSSVMYNLTGLRHVQHDHQQIAGFIIGTNKKISGVKCEDWKSMSTST
uniref:Uncharacterized protein n=1 Tax=Rhizophora mucronata TaxID=61149 RepID=A0A2P2Q0L1_RHIMU